MAEEREEGGNLTWFLIGIALGAACAILLAPKSGKETRDFISQKAQGAGDTITGTGRDLYERGKEVYDKGKQVVDDAAALFDRGRKLARG
jgi:gas vesicle protein